jgi:hypothetical protein
MPGMYPVFVEIVERAGHRRSDSATTHPSHLAHIVLGGRSNSRATRSTSSFSRFLVHKFISILSNFRLMPLWGQAAVFRPTNKVPTSFSANFGPWDHGEVSEYKISCDRGGETRGSGALPRSAGVRRCVPARSETSHRAYAEERARRAHLLSRPSRL